MPDGNSETNIPLAEWSLGSLKVYHDDKIAAAEAIAAAEVKRVDETIAELRRFFEQRFVDMDKAIVLSLSAAKEAVVKAEAANEKRFDSVNEFRKTLADQTGSFVTRNESEQQYRALTEKISDLNDRLTRGEGQQQGGDVTIGKIYAALGAVGAILAILVLLANGVFKG